MITRSSTEIVIDRLPVHHSAATDAMWVVAFSLVTGICAQWSIPLPFTHVPLTGQSFAVLLSGAVLGCRRGFLSQITYLAEGALGLPVFAGATGTILHLIGPTGGYLWSFPLAAALVGWLVEQGAARSLLKMAGALIAADSLILVTGSAWLHLLYGVSYVQAWLLGLYPFLLADIVKAILVGTSLPRLLRWFDTYWGESHSGAGPDC